MPTGGSAHPRGGCAIRGACAIGPVAPGLLLLRTVKHPTLAISLLSMISVLAPLAGCGWNMVTIRRLWYGRCWRRQVIVILGSSAILPVSCAFQAAGSNMAVRLECNTT